MKKNNKVKEVEKTYKLTKKETKERRIISVMKEIVKNPHLTTKEIVLSIQEKWGVKEVTAFNYLRESRKTIKHENNGTIKEKRDYWARFIRMKISDEKRTSNLIGLLKLLFEIEGLKKPVQIEMSGNISMTYIEKIEAAKKRKAEREAQKGPVKDLSVK